MGFSAHSPLTFRQPTQRTLLIERFVRELGEGETSFDIFKTLRQLCVAYGFEWFAVASFQKNDQKTLKQRMIVTNWPPELVEKLSNTPGSARIPSFLRVRASCVPTMLLFNGPGGTPLEDEVFRLHRHYGQDFGLNIPLRKHFEFDGFVALSGSGEPPDDQIVMEVSFVCGYAHSLLNRLHSLNAPGVAVLNDKQVAILRLMANGLASNEIAAQVGLSGSTTNYHVKSLLTALSARTAAQAVYKAALAGILED